MNPLDQQFKNLKHSLSLTSEEKAHMRKYLETVMKASVSMHQVPSPFFFVFSHKSIMAMAVLLLAVSSGGAASIAATNALPGDTLYALKIEVNERIERVASFSKEAKAKVDITHIEERLREVELLAALEDTDTRTVEDITTDISTRVARVHAAAKELEKEGALDAADGIASAVSLTLATHADLLQAQADGTDDISGGRLASLSQALETNAFPDEEISDNIISSSTVLFHKARIREALDVLTSTYAKETFREDTRIELARELVDIETLYEQADLLVGEEYYEQAHDVYEHLEQRIHLAQALLTTAVEIAQRSDKEVSISFGEAEPFATAAKQAADTTAISNEEASLLLMTAPAPFATASLMQMVAPELESTKLRFTIIDPEAEQ